MTIIDQLISAIEKSGKSQYTLARETGISRVSIGYILRREKVPSLDSLERLAKCVGFRLTLAPRKSLTRVQR